MITIKQVAPEYQSGELALDNDSTFTEYVFIPSQWKSKQTFRAFSEYKTECDYGYEKGHALEYYNEGVAEHGNNGVTFAEYYDCVQDESFSNACTFFKFALGGEWKTATIKGCCQSDWEEVIYNSSLVSPADLRDFETAWFNLGTEWIISDGHDNINYYCLATGTEEDIIKDLTDVASDYFGNDETEIYRFAGWKRIANYERV